MGLTWPERTVLIPQPADAEIAPPPIRATFARGRNIHASQETVEFLRLSVLHLRARGLVELGGVEAITAVQQ